MQATQVANNGNWSGENGTLPDLTNKELLEILLEEIARVREELKEDIRKGDEKTREELGGKIDSLRIEVHQNQTMFIKNHEELERRVGMLEGEGGKPRAASPCSAQVQPAVRIPTSQKQAELIPLASNQTHTAH